MPWIREMLTLFRQYRQAGRDLRAAVHEEAIWRVASPDEAYMVENYPECTMSFEAWQHEHRQTEERVAALRDGLKLGERVPYHGRL